MSLQMNIKTVFDNDLLFVLSEFLNDRDACNLFNTNKTTNKTLKKYKRYKIKSLVTDKMRIPSYMQITSLRTSLKCNNFNNTLIKLTLIGTHSNIELPSKLKYLECIGNMNLSNVKIPETVLSINLKQIGDVKLPNELENLSIEYCNQLNTDNLPKSLKYLTINGHFNNYIDNLPENLLHLKLSNNFNQTVPFLPKTLKYLRMGNDFEHPLPELPNLIVLYISRFYTHDLSHLPKSCKIYYE
jgi:hypothetical protein